MGKEQCKFKFQKCLRLLSILLYKKKFLILTFIVYYCSYIFALKINYPEVEMYYNTDPITIEDILYLKFKIKNYRFEDKLEQQAGIYLNDKYNFLTLEESSSYPLEENFIIENKYRINKIGKLKLDNIWIALGKNNIKQKTIELDIYPPVISKKTKFRWKIFNERNETNTIYINFNKKNNDINYKVIRGKKYYVCLEGLYYKKENGFPKLGGIEIVLPKNAILEKSDISPQYEQNDFGWSFLTSFFWTPVYGGAQDLPEAVFSILHENKIEKNISLKSVELFIDSINNSYSENNNNFYFFDSLMKYQNINNSLEYDNKTFFSFNKKIKMAEEIKYLRQAESFSLFSDSNTLKRKKLESDLGLEQSFPIIRFKNYILYIYFLIFLIFLATMIFLIKLRKKRFLLSVTLSFILLIIIFTYYTGFSDLRKDYVYLPAFEGFDSKIYQLPEKESSVLSNLKIGETVKIIYENNDWIYIEKFNGIKGWFCRYEIQHIE